MNVVSELSPVRLRPSYLVFSDVDETLIDCKSMFDFLRFQLVRRHGSAGEQTYRRIEHDILGQAAAGVPRAEVNRSFYRTAFAGESAAEMEQLGRAWFAARSAAPGFFIGRTLQELTHHRHCGAEVILVSGSFAPCLLPVAERVAAARVLCTTPVVDRGIYTGEVLEPMIGEGKREAVLRALADYPGVSPLECYAFGDHPSDVPMLDCVGHPRGVGDDPQLAAYLQQRGARAPAVAPRAHPGGGAVACWSMGCDSGGSGQGPCPEPCPQL